MYYEYRIMNKENKYFLITGPSASGKSTIAKLLLEKCSKLQKVITSTTRKPRSNEKDGVDYNFYSKEEFQEKLNNNEFIENARVYDNYYGMEKKEVDKIIDAGKTPLFVTDVQGAKKFPKIIPEIKIIFIVPESLEQIRKRLEKRNISDDIINIRMQLAEKEMSIADDFDYQVINEEGKIDKTVKKVLNIMSVD